MNLYDFWKKVKLSAFSFQDGDVVFGGWAGAMVQVEGAARYPFRFELESKKSSGQKFCMYYSQATSKKPLM